MMKKTRSTVNVDARMDRIPRTIDLDLPPSKPKAGAHNKYMQITQATVDLEQFEHNIRAQLQAEFRVLLKQ